MTRSGSQDIEPTIFHYIRPMTGSAHSVLARDPDNRLWVLKPGDCFQGPNALANEYLGFEISRAMGLPVPDGRIVRTEGGLRGPGTPVLTWLDQPRISDGLHFASRYVPDKFKTDMYEIIPPTLLPKLSNHSNYLGMFAFDVWAINADRRQALFHLSNGHLTPTFFDNSHLFGGPHGATKDPFINASLLNRIALHCHREKEAEADSWIARFEAVIPSALSEALDQIPLEWCHDNLQTLCEVLLARLARLRGLFSASVTRLERLLAVHSPEEHRAGSEYYMLLRNGDALWA